MDDQQARALLQRYNAWRRAEVQTDMPDPREIGVAIDQAIEALYWRARFEDALREIAAIKPGAASPKLRRAVQIASDALGTIPAASDETKEPS